MLIGGGTHAQSIIDSIESMKQYNIVGIIDCKDKVNTSVLGIKVIGEDQDLAYFFSNGVRNSAISIGSIGRTKLRRKMYAKCKEIGYAFPNIIDKSAVIASKVILGEGNFIGKGAILNSNVWIGNGCIINTGAILEHGCKIEDFVHVAPGSVLCGNVWVKDNSHIGAHSTVLQNVTIGKDTLIGAGSLVLKNIHSNQLAYGSPVKEVEPYESGYDYRGSRSES